MGGGVGGGADGGDERFGGFGREMKARPDAGCSWRLEMGIGPNSTFCHWHVSILQVCTRKSSVG